MSNFVKQPYDAPILMMMRQAIKAGTAKILLWAEVASQRRHLQSLSDEMLDDIGFSRSQARLEAARPFWDIQATQRKSGELPAGPHQFTQLQANWQTDCTVSNEI